MVGLYGTHALTSDIMWQLVDLRSAGIAKMAIYSMLQTVTFAASYNNFGHYFAGMGMCNILIGVVPLIFPILESPLHLVVTRQFLTRDAMLAQYLPS